MIKRFTLLLVAQVRWSFGASGPLLALLVVVLAALLQGRLVQLVGGAADPIGVKLTSTNATVIAQAVSGNARVSVPWVRFTALDNTLPTLGIYIEKTDGTKVYIRPASKAMGDKESLLFDEGYVLLPGWKLYAIAGTADKIDVTGLALLGDGNA